MWKRKSKEHGTYSTAQKSTLFSVARARFNKKTSENNRVLNIQNKGRFRVVPAQFSQLGKTCQIIANVLTCYQDREFLTEILLKIIVWIRKMYANIVEYHLDKCCKMKVCLQKIGFDTARTSSRIFSDTTECNGMD